MSTLLKKSFRDLSKKKARTIFTIITIALGVMGMGLLAVTPLAEQEIKNEMDNTNMYNIQVTVTDVQLNNTQLQELGKIKNIKSLEPRALLNTRMYIGARRNNAVIVGVDDFNDQRVDVITKTAGTNPGYMEVLTDIANEVNGVYSGDKGDRFRIIDFQGMEQNLTITGKGKNLIYSGNSLYSTAIFYADIETVRAQGNLSGYNVLSFDLDKTDRTSMELTVEDIRSYLVNTTSVVAFSNLPIMRNDSQWPGQDMLAQLIGMMYILMLLALLCSVFLISNTMNTIISEQRSEIAQMKAIGATKYQVFRSYLTTSLILGLIGAILGAVLGTMVTYLVLSTLARPFGFEVGFMVHMPTIILSLMAGIGVVIAASIPALVRSSKVNVHEGLQSHGIASLYGRGGLEKLFLRLKFLPRSVQMGLRNTTRKKGRSAATILQIALAVGVFLGLTSFGYSLSTAVAGAWDDMDYDIVTYGQTEGAQPLTEDSAEILTNIDGVDYIEPTIQTMVQIGDHNIATLGYIPDTKVLKYEKIVEKGRWITAADSAANARVLLIGPAIAVIENIHVGDNVRLTTATGEEQFKVVGLFSTPMNNGLSVIMPFSTLQDILKWNNTVSGFAIKTTSNDHGFIDKVSTEIEDQMLKNGFIVNNQIHYVGKRQNQQINQGIVDLMLVISLIIVLISMIGLMSTLTMNILDRTKEIGLLRCIGARSRDIRGVFAAEGVFLSFIGWLIGLPTGFFIAYVVTSVVEESLNLKGILELQVPPLYIFYALLISLIGTFLIIQGPLWRATHYKPGEALRYQ